MFCTVLRLTLYCALRCSGLFFSASTYQWARQEKLDKLEEQWSSISPATQEQLQLVREFRRARAEAPCSNIADQDSATLCDDACVPSCHCTDSSWSVSAMRYVQQHQQSLDASSSHYLNACKGRSTSAAGAYWCTRRLA
jgi:hypothetical protein